LKKWPGEFPRRAFLSIETNRVANLMRHASTWLTATTAMTRELLTRMSFELHQRTRTEGQFERITNAARNKTYPRTDAAAYLERTRITRGR
jgi:hypothetical protein